MITGVRQQLPDLIPIHELPDLIPSSRRGKKLALATIYRWCEQGRIPTVKVGGSRYVARDALARLLSAADDDAGNDPSVEPNGTAAVRAGVALDRLLGPRRGSAGVSTDAARRYNSREQQLTRR